MANNGLKRMKILCALLTLALGFVSACSIPTPAPSTSQQLRIVNAGSVNITGLSVLFPGESADAPATQVEFGDIAAGQTTEYRTVPGGVYRYAAYAYQLNGLPVNQAVVDWVGETPIRGTKFTYRIALNPQEPPGGQIQLLEVRLDAP